MRRVGLANPRGTFRSAKWIVSLSMAWTVSCAESAQEDPHATKYHFAIPGDGNPGDSNGAFWHAGRYHLMFLYKRADGFAWGHASSPDMLSWQRHADAIGPGPKEPEGCYSGGAFVDDDGKAYLSYWMIRGAIGLGLARGEAPFESWEKVPENPIVRSTSWGWTKTLDAAGREVRYASADPSNIWKKDGRYYFVAGNLCLLDDNGRKPGSPEEMKGDCAYLFESEDLRKWTYRHPFYQRRVTESRATGWTDADEDCMCPSFLPLPTREGKPSGRHLLLFISHNRGCQYYIGTYDAPNDRFLPERHGRMTWLDKTYFAPEALIDGRGRQIVWTWLLDNRQDEFRRFGRTGVYALPRSLWLNDDGSLGMAPVEELEALRRDGRDFGSVALTPGASLEIAGVSGDCCEIAAEIEPPSAGSFALEVRATPDGAEKAVIRLDEKSGELVFDATRCTAEAVNGFCRHVPVERAPFRLNAGESLRLRVYVDGPVIEVCANERQMITRRVWPEHAAQARRIRLVSVGGGACRAKVRAWDIQASGRDGCD